jgi:hypothetical protein
VPSVLRRHRDARAATPGFPRPPQRQDRRILSAGLPLAGQRVTLRLEGPVAHVLAAGILVRALACPVPPEARPRLRGARPGTAQPPRLPEPLVVTRRVPVSGA